jgi:hypothetical protein
MEAKRQAARARDCRSGAMMNVLVKLPILLIDDSLRKR